MSAAARTYRFPARDRSGWLLGLQAAQCIILGVGVFAGGILLNVGAPCTMMPALFKSGIIQFFSVYFSFWIVLEAVSKYPDKLPWLRDTAQDIRLKFATPVRLASWRAAVILLFAAKPNEAIPFVYFQF